MDRKSNHTSRIKVLLGVGILLLAVFAILLCKTRVLTLSAEIRETAIKAGMVTMKQDSLLKVLQKITTMEETERVLG